jgi:hypothetical protein
MPLPGDEFHFDDDEDDLVKEPFEEYLCEPGRDEGLFFASPMPWPADAVLTFPDGSAARAEMPASSV